MDLIPITILTGFLGAGKTTLLNRLMQSNPGENVVIIVNEYGDVSIDHQLVLAEEEKIIQLNNGCMCCILREDLVDLFSSILQVAKNGSAPIDRIIIETSGLAEPSPIAQTILRTPIINQHFVIDSILTVVDAVNGAYQLQHYSEAKEQVAFADKILLTKTELTQEKQVQQLKKELSICNPFIAIETLNLETVDYGQLIGLDLFDHTLTGSHKVEEDINQMLSHQHVNGHRENNAHDHPSSHSGQGEHGEHPHHHHHTIVDSLALTVDEVMEKETFFYRLQLLISKYGMKIMRYKGILYLKGERRQYILQGVNMVFKIEEGRNWINQPQTKIVLIGRDLPQKEIRALFLAE